jgi:hypothetical protein
MIGSFRLFPALSLARSFLIVIGLSAFFAAFVVGAKYHSIAEKRMAMRGSFELSFHS